MKRVLNPGGSLERVIAAKLVQLPSGETEFEDDVAGILVHNFGHLGVRIVTDAERTALPTAEFVNPPLRTPSSAPVGEGKGKGARRLNAGSLEAYNEVAARGLLDDGTPGRAAHGTAYGTPTYTDLSKPAKPLTKAQKAKARKDTAKAKKDAAAKVKADKVAVKKAAADKAKADKAARKAAKK